MSDGDGSSAWKYIGIGCGVAVLLSLCAVGGCIACGAAGVGGVFAATEAPATASHGLFSDIRGGNLTGAYGRMSETYRATHLEATFDANVHSVPGLDGNTDSTFTGRAINNGTATMTGVLTTPSGALPAIVILHDDGGGNWAIDSVMVSGRPL